MINSKAVMQLIKKTLQMFLMLPYIKLIQDLILAGDLAGCHIGSRIRFTPSGIRYLNKLQTGCEAFWST